MQHNTVEEFEQDIALTAKKFGAEYIAVEADYEKTDVRIYTDLQTPQRQQLFKAVSKERPTGVTVTVCDARNHSGYSIDDSTEQSKSSWNYGNDTLLPEAETPQRSIERVCDEYVSGGIETVLELEEELEAPITEQLQAEGLLV